MGGGGSGRQDPPRAVSSPESSRCRAPPAPSLPPLGPLRAPPGCQAPTREKFLRDLRGPPGHRRDQGPVHKCQAVSPESRCREESVLLTGSGTVSLRLALRNGEESADRQRPGHGWAIRGALSRGHPLRKAQGWSTWVPLALILPCVAMESAGSGQPGSLWLPRPLLLRTPCLALNPAAEGGPHRHLLPGQPLPAGPLRPLRTSPRGGDRLWPWRTKLQGRLHRTWEQRLQVGKPTAWPAHWATLG